MIDETNKAKFVFIFITTLVTMWFLFYAQMPGSPEEHNAYLEVFYVFFLLPVDIFAIIVFLTMFITDKKTSNNEEIT